MKIFLIYIYIYIYIYVCVCVCVCVLCIRWSDNKLHKMQSKLLSRFPKFRSKINPQKISDLRISKEAMAWCSLRKTDIQQCTITRRLQLDIGLGTMEWDVEFNTTMPRLRLKMLRSNFNIFETIDDRAKKILSPPSFGGEVKPSVQCRRFTARKRSLNLRGSWNLGKITTGHLSRPQFHLSLLGPFASLRTQRHVAAKVGTSKSGGKQCA